MRARTLIVYRSYNSCDHPILHQYCVWTILHIIAQCRQMYLLLCFQPVDLNPIYNEKYSLINIKTYLITFGGIMHTVYGANFIGHLISLFVDKISTANIMIRLNPRPKQPITIGFSLFCSIYVAFNGCEYFVSNKNVCPTCNYHLCNVIYFFMTFACLYL